MSIANGNVATMNNDDLLEKAKILSEYFVLVFEDYWVKGGKEFDGDVVEFMLFTHNLTFQVAFAYAHKMIKPDGLTEDGIADIHEAHDILVNSMDLE